MRFVCDSCRAQYMISDDKVGPKGVKVRCKKCGFVILVRKPEPATVGELAETQVMTTQIADAAAADAAAQNVISANAPGSNTETSGLFSGVGEDEIGAVFDQVLSGAPPPSSEPPPDDEEFASTRVVDASTLKKLALAGESFDDKKPAEPEPAPAVQHDWYVAIEEKQQGPFNLEKIRDLWERGEISADNLCWRPGFSDWLPLAEVSELAALLAPRKPVISAQATMSVTGNAVVDTPEDNGPSGAEATSDWQPSAASALASLVKDEISALAQTKAKAPEPEPTPDAPPVLIPALGDAPPPDDSDVSTVVRGSPMREAMTEERTRTGVRSPLAAEAPMAPMAPIASAQPFQPPPYAYHAPVAHQGFSRKMIAVIGGIGGLLVVLLLIVVYMLGRTERPVEVAVAPRPVQTQPPVTQQPPVQQTPPQRQTPPANTTQPAVTHNPANSTTPAVAQNPTTQAPATQAPQKTEPAKTDVAQQTPAETHPRHERHHRVVSHSRPDTSDQVAQADPPPKKEHPAGSNADSAFDAIFGGGGGNDSTPPPSNSGHKRHNDVYVPPAPGEDDVPDQLGQSDIMSVVLANKGAIVRCVSEQKQRDPNLSGKLVMRWSIQPSGRTSGVSVRTDEFRHTYMASCISGLIRGWRFPRHKQQGAPIDFPFTF